MHIAIEILLFINSIFASSVILSDLVTTCRFDCMVTFTELCFFRVIYAYMLASICRWLATERHTRSDNRFAYNLRRCRRELHFLNAVSNNVTSTNKFTDLWPVARQKEKQTLFVVCVYTWSRLVRGWTVKAADGRQRIFFWLLHFCQIKRPRRMSTRWM